jgi:hypothetical protein
MISVGLKHRSGISHDPAGPGELGHAELGDDPVGQPALCVFTMKPAASFQVYILLHPAPVALPLFSIILSLSLEFFQSVLRSWSLNRNQRSLFILPSRTVIFF